MAKNGKLITAAGAVVLRPGADGEPEVLLVHRPRYDDWRDVYKRQVQVQQGEPAGRPAEVVDPRDRLLAGIAALAQVNGLSQLVTLGVGQLVGNGLLIGVEEEGVHLIDCLLYTSRCV